MHYRYCFFARPERPSRSGCETVILPAALVYEKLCRLSGLEEILVPHVGVREGVLFDLGEDLTGQRSPEDFHEQEVRSAAVNLGRRFFFDEAHALQVAKLAFAIFDSLPSVHGLCEGDRRLLLAAALLHDVGQYISYKKHHKHSMYLIAESELPGIEPEKLLVVAHVARYHRKGEPSPEHESFASLAPADRKKVEKLSALLRIADALDREHGQKVTEMSVQRAGGEVLLHLKGTSDLLLELWFLKRKAAYFTRLFGLTIRVVVEPS